MSWDSVAAIAASATLVFSVIVFGVLPKLQKSKWRKILPKIIELKDKAVCIQNDYWRNLSPDELSKFHKEVEDLKEELLNEIAKVSKSQAARYKIYGTVDITPFLSISNSQQRMMLGYIRRTWQIADEIIDKYS